MRRSAKTGELQRVLGSELWVVGSEVSSCELWVVGSELSRANSSVRGRFHVVVKAGCSESGEWEEEPGSYYGGRSSEI